LVAEGQNGPSSIAIGATAELADTTYAGLAGKRTIALRRLAKDFPDFCLSGTKEILIRQPCRTLVGLPTPRLRLLAVRYCSTVSASAYCVSLVHGVES